MLFFIQSPFSVGVFVSEFVLPPQELLKVLVLLTLCCWLRTLTLLMAIFDFETLSWETFLLEYGSIALNLAPLWTS